jgi:hypothetical protein
VDFALVRSINGPLSEEEVIAEYCLRRHSGAVKVHRRGLCSVMCTDYLDFLTIWSLRTRAYCGPVSSKAIRLLRAGRWRSIKVQLYLGVPVITRRRQIQPMTVFQAEPSTSPMLAAGAIGHHDLVRQQYSLVDIMVTINTVFFSSA